MYNTSYYLILIIHFSQSRRSHLSASGEINIRLRGKYLNFQAIAKKLKTGRNIPWVLPATFKQSVLVEKAKITNQV